MDIQNKIILELISLSFEINKKKLINNISLKIEEKDMVSIIGPNGSGKSTLIRLISNEISPSSGEVFFQNKLNSAWDPIDLALSRSVLSQSSHLSFPFSVLDIVKMGRYPSKRDNLGINDDDICKYVLNIFDLSDYINRNYITLSGGEKQRVQLARVVVQIWSENKYKNKLLILDEPTSYLDINHQSMLFEFLKDMNKKGLTIIMVLHDLNHAMINSSKIVMLKNANLIAYGKVDEVINNQNLKKVFDIDLALINNKELNKPLITFKKQGG